MRINPADHAFSRSTRPHFRSSFTTASQKRASRPRMPSTAGYMVGAAATAAALFFMLWWMLPSGSEEASWVPAGLAATVVMLVAVAAREVVVRRAWTRYILEQDRHDHSAKKTRKPGPRKPFEVHAAALRALQKQSAEADAAGGALPEAHLEAFQTCKEYLASTDETLRSPVIMAESRVALRAGQERVRALQKHHLLSWARGMSRVLTHEAQQRARVSDRIETAMRALDVIDSALKLYPEESELNESGAAVREFIAAVKIAHWVELAERAAFKGQYRRAINRYRDALFYVSRDGLKEESRAEAAERIGREIERLRARLKVSRMAANPPRK